MTKLKIIVAVVILLIAGGAAYFVITRAGEPSGTVIGKDSADAFSGTKQEYGLIAADGGSIALASTKISFPPESLKSDAVIQVSEMPQSSDREVVVPGFELTEKGKSSGPEMTSPALIVFTLDDVDSTALSIFRYTDDGYKLIPSHVAQKDGKTVVYAGVAHFSSYGVRRLLNGESADKTEYPDYNWVIYAQDSYDIDSGAMKRKVTLDFKAVNTSGDIAGEYKGYAHAKTSNDMDIGDGGVTADSSVNDDSVSFSLEPYVELGDLVERDDGLANLEPEKLPDFMGQGSLNMSGAGSGTVSARGYTYGAGLKVQDSHDALTVSVTGPLVRLTVNVNGIGTLYFDGYVRGEAK
ncbi:MAG: hypothetical protein RDU25_02240 [Patescibacteria group bacterium]|nr:hypothetical protein [Patescibacteria group bacterium]